MPFKFTPQEIRDIYLVEPTVFKDERGVFMETHKQSDFATYGIPPFVQSNHSRSTYGVLRGMHYQIPPKAQGKLVYVTWGAIFDVGVDIRNGSPTYGQWVGQTLSDENHHMLYIPPGFAHGFCVLSAMADVIYHITTEYSHEHERGILWNDADIGIAWPIEILRTSDRDARQPCLQNADNNFTYTAPGET